MWLTACNGGGNSTYTPTPGPEGSKKKLSMYLEIIPHHWQEAIDSVEKWVQALGGNIHSKTKEDERSCSYSVLLPVTKASYFVEKVRSLGKVRSERTFLADITQEYADLEAKLKAKDAAIQRLQALLQQAHTPKEILEVEKSLQQALQERDELQSALKAKQHSTEMVEIEIYLQNRRYVEYNQGGSYWDQLLRSLASGWEGLVYFTFIIAYLWWVWLIILFLIVFLRWLSRRKKQSPPPKA
ncbi:MAG: DUF4349 domain-containing protein [Bacteroidia bacterium]|nr:DUF4349 domain-containing protein [Bacteroidia bacterium]MDW8133991.1 DUF4349 domain-containing protein [Bacteroidia bacterium]